MPWPPHSVQQLDCATPTLGRSRHIAVLSLFAFTVATGFAQTPSADMDNWVQFPPRPRPVLPSPPSPTTASAVNSPRAAMVTLSQPSPAVALTRDETPVVATPNERDNWIRFPIRAAAPVAVAPAVAQQANVMPVAEKPALRLAGFKLSGNQRLSSSFVLAELRPFVGQLITQDNLLKATEKISAFYQANGLLAIAEMPAQDLTAGWAEIKIIEAKFSGAVVEDPQGQLANTSLPLKMVERLQPKDEAVYLPALDQAAALMAEIPGVETKLSLRPGDKPGETQAVTTILPGKTVEGSVAIDNAGTRATGELRESGKVTLNNPLKIGDAVSAQVLHSEGLTYQKYSYSLPVGDAGWRAGVNTSALQYKLVSSEFANLNARGPSSTQGVDLTIPWVREKLSNVSLQLAYDQKKFKNEAIDVVQSNYSGNALTTYLEANRNSGNGGATSGSIQWVNGNIDLSNSTAAHQLSDASTLRTEGNFSKVRVALTHKQDLDANNSVVLSGQSQWANKNLDSSERFYLGGMQGVRAYPTNEAGGALGQLLTLEWQKHFSLNQNRWTAAGFYDAGRVTVNKNNNFTGAASPNQYGISGVGIWLGTTVRNGYGISTLRLIASQRLGQNPGATATGNDQDGSHVLTRYRFSLNHAF